MNVAGYYDHMVTFLAHAVEQQFVKEVHGSMLLIEDDAEALLARFDAYSAPTGDKWVHLSR